jgi:hypothetical protein
MFRRACLIGTLAVLVIAPALWAQNDDKDKPKQEKQATPAEEYRALVREYSSAMQEYRSALQAAKTTADRQEAAKKAPKNLEFALKFLDLAKKNPTDPIAIDSLVWVVQNAGTAPAGNEAVEILIEEHLENSKVGSLFQRLTPSLSPGMEKLARAALEKNPNKTTKRQACLALATHFKNRRQPDEAEKFLQRVVDEFADMNSLVQVVQNNASGPSGEQAIEILIKEHMNNPGFASALQQLGAGRPSPSVVKIFRAVIEKSESRDAQGTAALELGQFLKGQAGTAQTVKMLQQYDEARLKQYETAYGAEYVKQMLALDADAATKEAESLLDKVVTEYGDVKGAGSTLGDAAGPDLHELRTLSVGKIVPDVEAEDTDGETFKLSDYRGKVVMVDFWGHW